MNYPASIQPLTLTVPVRLPAWLQVLFRLQPRQRTRRPAATPTSGAAAAAVPVPEAADPYGKDYAEFVLRTRDNVDEYD